MTKIAFIGAGSLGFTRALVRDILTFPLLRDATLALMDIDPERLEFAKKSVQRIIDLGNYPATVSATLDRVEALATDPHRHFHTRPLGEVGDQMFEQNKTYLPYFKRLTV